MPLAISIRGNDTLRTDVLLRHNGFFLNLNLNADIVVIIIVSCAILLLEEMSARSTHHIPGVLLTVCRLIKRWITFFLVHLRDIIEETSRSTSSKNFKA